MRPLLSDTRTFLSLLLVSVILLVVDSFGILSYPKAAITFITSPIQYGLYKTQQSVGKQLSFIFVARRASQENSALKVQLGELLSENSILRRQLAETESKLTQQQSLSPSTFKLIEARPIGISRYLYIDKGTDDNLKVDQVVIFKDTYIGKIIEAEKNRSKVILSSDPDSKVAAFINSNSGRARGVLTGQFGSELLLDKILHEEPVSVDDLVYSEGTELSIPKGLILGTVSEVIEKDNEVFKSAKVRPSFNIEELDLVFVITE